jgi:NhaA family Na+:H+ antiporter
MTDAHAQPTRLDRPVDPGRDHILGNPSADITLLEFGSYDCPYCHAAHEVIADLRDKFGDRMRYVFRHRPIMGSATATEAAELAEYAAETTDKFWDVHDALMKRGPVFKPGDFDQIASEFELPPSQTRQDARLNAARKVQADRSSAQKSGARFTPTFFINNRRYEGTWDKTALSEAMLGSLGHRLHSATVDFLRWAPAAGFLLLLMSLIAILLENSPAGAAFAALWETPFALALGDRGMSMPLRDWINHGLLTIFFLVVGLEIKREFTVGRLSTRRAAALPVAAALGGMTAPALIYLAIVPAGPLMPGWGVPIATDTAFAIALLIMLGDRIPIELRIFLTAAVVVDDLVAIAVVALFYTRELHVDYLAASVFVTAAIGVLNRIGVYRPLPYAILGLVLWLFLHDAGVHATLAGVVLAILTPTRPPPDLLALMAQAETIVHAEMKSSGEPVMRHGPSQPALEALDAIHDRIESPADKLLRTIEPWSSFFVLPIFALANAGVVLSPEVVAGHERLMLAIILGLVVGKPLGITLTAALAVRSGLAEKPDAYSWRQLFGAGVIGGIGFTMSLFIASQAFPIPAEFAAAKIAIFIASLIAGAAGLTILWARHEPAEAHHPPEQVTLAEPGEARGA